MSRLLTPSAKRTIMTLREDVSALEKERIQLEDEIESDKKRIELALLQISKKPEILNVTEVMDRINANIEQNMHDLKIEKIKRKGINKKITKLKEEIANKKIFNQINEQEIEQDENIVSEYYTLSKELCMPRQFPDLEVASHANWTIAKGKGGDITPQLFELMEELHKFDGNFQDLSKDDKLNAFRTIQKAKKAINIITDDYIMLSKQEALGIDGPRIRIEKKQCASDYTYLKLSIDRIFR